MKHDATALLRAAERAAQRAATFLREQEGRMTPDQWSLKGRADFVTEVDRESERMIAEDLEAAVPGSTVMGEELTPDAARAAHREPPTLQWIVDPLDGTTNFLHRFPMYAVSIAAVLDGALEAACVLHVPPGIRYTAVRGMGARQDGRPLACSPIADPAHALIGTGFPYRDAERQLPRYLPMFRAVVERAAGLRRPGSASLDLCDVAAGRYDGFFELMLAPWDVAAGTLIVREAGGTVTTLGGDPDVLRHGAIVAGNPAIQAWLVELLSGVGNRESASDG